MSTSNLPHLTRSGRVIRYYLVLALVGATAVFGIILATYTVSGQNPADLGPFSPMSAPAGDLSTIVPLAGCVLLIIALWAQRGAFKVAAWAMGIALALYGGLAWASWKQWFTPAHSQVTELNLHHNYAGISWWTHTAYMAAGGLCAEGVVLVCLLVAAGVAITARGFRLLRMRARTQPDPSDTWNC